MSEHGDSRWGTSILPSGILEDFADTYLIEPFAVFGSTIQGPNLITAFWTSFES
jgi:hypothetical protein